MTCITQNESIRFVNKMVRHGINIMNPSFINVYSSLGSRQKSKMCNTIVKDMTRTASYPAFYMLNLLINTDSQKHSMLLVLDKNKQEYTLELFDSNGQLDDCFFEVNVLNLIKMMIPILEIKLDAKVSFVEVRAGLSNINIVGNGNCDALTLYYASIRSKLSMYHTNDILDQSPMSKQRISVINRNIRATRIESWF